MRIKINKIITIVLLLCISVLSYADDTDIFGNEKPSESNILFVMDMSASMNWGEQNWQLPANPADSRKSILQSALRAVLTDPTLININVGLASFAGDQNIGAGSQRGHGITYPVSPIDSNAQTQLNQNPLFSHPGTSYLPIAGARSTRSYLSEEIPSTWTPFGGTPIVDALYEAALYFRGMDPFWGRQDPSNVRSSHPSTYTGLIEDVTTSITDPNVCGRVSCIDDGSCDEATKQCNPYTPTNTCLTATCGTNCTLHTNNNCTYSCPDGLYNEIGACINPVNTCNPYDYYRCEAPEVTSCTHEVCGPVTSNSTAPTGSATYNSPINDVCSNNAIVLLSDGSPTKNNSADLVRNLVGAPYHNNCNSGSEAGRCGNELVKFLANEDNDPSLPEKQTVKLHSIGMQLGNYPQAAAYLEGLATNGGGQFVTANTVDSLVEALKEALTFVSKARTFSSPTYTTTSAKSLSHNNNVYLPVFDRSIGPTWSGNLKKYTRVAGDLKDADGNNATDTSGALKDEARDFWSADASVQAVTSGGVANKIDPVKRSNGTTPVYTDNGSSGAAASLIPLNNGLSNSLFEKAPVSVDTDYKNKLVNFILGKNPDGTARHHMGDIIHSKPVYVNYGGSKVLFVGTNEGYLHAINESTGEELFSFMPSELLKNIETQYRNDALDKHVYGVDGPMTIWHDDTDKDNIVDAGETAILYFGLRRGGKSYYALDISSRLHPSLKWRIKNTGQFNNLGLTWSQPSISKMKYGSSPLKPVLVFGGGYIDDNGSLGAVETDGSTATGTEVYIVDAMTGAKIWKISDSSAVPANAKKYAKPAKIRVIDINRDGSLDRLYYSDTGGNVWRVDFLSTNLSEAKVRHLASLGGSATTGRKFFTEPDVALFRRGGQYLASVSIGSGERPKPLDASRDDHFFVLFDKTVVSIPAVMPAAITIGDLLNATGGPVDVFAANKDGWYIDLTQLTGEKVLSTSMTFQSMVFFSSFGTTATLNTNVCDISRVNQSRLYALDLLSGSAALDFDGNGTPEISQPGPPGEIPGEIQVIVKPPSSASGGACVQGDCVRLKEVVLGKGKSVALPPSNELQRVYWIDED